MDRPGPKEDMQVVGATLALALVAFIMVCAVVGFIEILCSIFD